LLLLHFYILYSFAFFFVLLCVIVGALATSDCPANSHFEECGTACPLTCENYKNPPKFCVLMCSIGCHCDAGYVKAKDGSCVLPENCHAQATEKVCLAKPETGMCRGYFPMYYYNVQTGSCHEFVYGGCGGNGNRYATEEECLNHCGDVKLREYSSEVCDLPAEVGVCRGYFPRYAFDRASGQCKEFVYGGCGGNGNNFETVQQCESACKAEASTSAICEQEKVVGPCRAIFRKFYFNKATGQCEMFIYGGCQGNDNKFNTKKQCESACLA